MKKRLFVFALVVLQLVLCGCTKSASSPSGSVMPPKSKYVEYAGAILPLTTREPCDGLSVQRNLNLDFSRWTSEDGITAVKDEYKLTNITESPVDLMLYYPIASSLKEWRGESCHVDINKIPTAHKVYRVLPDFYDSGRFEIYDNNYDDPYSIGDDLMMWMEYTYRLERAFEPTADLSKIMAYRYRIVDVEYDSFWPMPKEASLCLSYDQDGEQGCLVCYGFTTRGADVSTPGTVHNWNTVLVDDVENAVLIGLNGKLTDYSLYGVSSKWAHEGRELPELTARLEIEALPLSQILNEAIEQHLSTTQPEIDAQLYQKEAVTLIGNDIAQKDDGGENLEYYLSIISNHERIFWLEIPVSVDAGEEIVVTVSHERTGGAETDGPAAREGVWHYDILPDYGTNLNLDSQFITVTENENIVITKEDLGRKLIEGFVPDQEFYHFSVEDKG